MKPSSLFCQAWALLDKYRLEAAREKLRAQSPPAPKKNKMAFLRDWASLYGWAGMPGEARHFWEQAEIAKLPPLVVALEMAVLDGLEGNWSDGATRILPELEKQPHNSVLRFVLGWCRLEMEGVEVACKTWQAQKAGPHIFPAIPDYLSLAALSLEKRQCRSGEKGALKPSLGAAQKALMEGKSASALEVLNKLDESRKKDESDLLFLKGLAELEEKQPEIARDTLAALLEKGDDHFHGFAFLARALAETGHPEPARKLLAVIPEMGPDDFFRHYTTGVVEGLAGCPFQSRLAFRQAFSRFFYDSFHYLFLPRWKKVFSCKAGLS